MANQVCFITKQFGDQAHTLESYLKTGGYQAWRKILEEKRLPKTLSKKSRILVCVVVAVQASRPV